MRIIYEANDGTRFDDEYECMDYEKFCENSAVKTIDIWNITNEHEHISLQYSATQPEYYELADILTIPDEEALEALHNMADYMGYSDFATINSPGKWQFVADKVRLERIG